MSSDFIQKWHEAREQKNSNIIAGLDPAIYDMGHDQQGLPEGVDFVQWCAEYIEAVAPYVAGIKFNQAYFQGVGFRGKLEELMHVVRNHDLLSISDNKIADIGNTNDAWIHFNTSLRFDAITIAPYGGNIEKTIEMAHTNNLGAITLCLMSNPEYRTEMEFQDPETQEPLWKNRVVRAQSAEVDAIVVGGTYTTKDRAFMEFVKLTNASETLYLIPGIGAQGGDITEFLASGIRPEKCMINSGRAVMFPNGSASTPEEQATAAKSLRDEYNQAVTN